MADALPYTTVYYHTPLGRFSVFDISTVGKESVPRRSALEASRRELSGYLSFGPGTLFLGCRVIDLGKLSQGGVVYTVAYGTFSTFSPWKNAAVLRAVLIEGRFVEISRVFFSQFLVFQIFFSFFPNIWHAKPSKHFALCEISKFWKCYLLFLLFRLFLGKKKRKIWKKKSCSIRTALIPSDLSQKWECGSKRVRLMAYLGGKF